MCDSFPVGPVHALVTPIVIEMDECWHTKYRAGHPPRVRFAIDYIRGQEARGFCDHCGTGGRKFYFRRDWLATRLPAVAALSEVNYQIPLPQGWIH